LFEQDKSALAEFSAMAYTHQREYAKHITEGIQPETRVRRAAKVLRQIREKTGIAE
jgi:uncharacterized protein YdeI (YjbR/CyaY-like superfamily)